MSGIFVNYKLQITGYRFRKIQRSCFHFQNFKYSSRFFLFIFFFLQFFSLHFSFSQSLKQYIKEGDKRFTDADYYGAEVYYKTVLTKDPTLINIIYKCAESSRLCNDYQSAEQLYTKVFSIDKKDDYPLCVFWLAMVKKSNGKYKEAKKLFEKYYKKNKKQSDYFAMKAQNEITSCDYAIELMLDSVPVAIQHPDTGINSIFTDFAASQGKDSVLYFSSLRIDTNSTIYTGNYFTKIYQSLRKDPAWLSPQIADTPFNSPDYHNANVAFSGDYKRFYFTRCHTNEKAEMKCKIFVSEWKNNLWQQAVPLNDEINLHGYTATQPTIGTDSAGNETLYFVSDMPGGKGKLDIWASAISQDGKYGKPINLGATVNSIDDEVTPFYDSKTKTLYFSSNWYNGLGGFDIFKTKYDNTKNEWITPENLGRPINCRYNDLYFTVNPDERSGYFTSNRIGSYFVQGETCCNDIYTYQFPKPKNHDTVIVVETPKTDIEKQIKLLVPLTLYFHNDEPDAKTQSTVTQKNYKTTFDEYLTMIEKYKTEYSKGSKGEEKEKAEQDITDFFDEYVANGFHDLEKFAALLLENLKKGKTCTVTMKGYCSPLASSEYNINLAKRRISSLKNYLNEYQNGILQQYENTVPTDTSANKGILIFAEEDIGELQASPEVSDNPNDQKNSVYSRKAALERKIQIIAISVEK